MTNLAAVDTKLGDIVALIAYYSSLSLALEALDNDAMPSGHTFFLDPLVKTGTTTFSANKKILKQLTAIVDNTKTKVPRSNVRSVIKVEIEKCKAEFSTLAAQRSIITNHIDNAKANTIIKSARAKPSVAKARAHVTRVAKMNGLVDHDIIQSYIE